jgi:hypothetical protein
MIFIFPQSYSWLHPTGPAVSGIQMYGSMFRWKSEC